MSQLRAPHAGWLAAAVAAELIAMGAYARMQQFLLLSAGLRVPIYVVPVVAGGGGQAGAALQQGFDDPLGQGCECFRADGPSRDRRQQASVQGRSPRRPNVVEQRAGTIRPAGPSRGLPSAGEARGRPDQP